MNVTGLAAGSLSLAIVVNEQVPLLIFKIFAIAHFQDFLRNPVLLFCFMWLQPIVLVVNEQLNAIAQFKSFVCTPTGLLLCFGLWVKHGNH